MSVKKRLQVKIFGQVQGVNFRYYTTLQARKLGLAGFVRNLPDGKVEVMAEGEQEILQRFLEWCQLGPVGAQVEKVEAFWAKTKGQFDKFEIRY